MDNSFRISSGAVSDRGLSEKRPQNEDSYLEMPQSGIYAVADGVGGAQAGEVASQMAMEILGEAFTNRHDGDDPERVMRMAIERANAAIHQMARELPQLANMATTIVALHLDGNIATIGHVGDSRLYRVDRAGILYGETADHSMVAEEVRAGRMTAEQAENHPSRNIISRALGAEATVDIDLKTIMIEGGTAFLICSDGITRHVNDQEIKGVLTFGGDPAEIGEYLKNLCYERGAEDNLTAVVIKVTSDRGSATGTAPEITSDGEDATITGVRPEFNATVFGDGELLELEDTVPTIPETPLEMPDAHAAEEDTIAILYEEPAKAVPIDQLQQTYPDQVIDKPAAAQPDQTKEESFSMFGDSGNPVEGVEKSGTLAKIASALAMLVIGSLIGLGVYHFALVPKPVDTTDQKLSVMKTDDIAFSSFEKLRRNVDADPAAYIKEVPPADDAEDYYLIGRAYLLVGDFPKARLALIEAQKQIAKVEPANAKILNTDIASALLITNDPTIQGRFRQELDASSKQLTNTDGKTNVNR